MRHIIKQPIPLRKPSKLWLTTIALFVALYATRAGTLIAENDSKQDAEPVVISESNPAHTKVAVINARTSLTVVLLAGVNAPTDGTPYPAVFKVVGELNDRDGLALPFKEARIIAAAYGSMADSRAVFRLTELHVKYPDDRRHTIAIDGWIEAQGIRGIAGELIDPIGKGISGSSTTGPLDSKLKERIEQLIPTVAIKPHKEATAVFANSFSIPLPD